MLQYRVKRIQFLLRMLLLTHLLSKTTAVSKEQIIYAPADTYTNESIQTYIELFENLANTLAK